MKSLFGHMREFEGWVGFPHLIEELIEKHALQTSCEVGAGANPGVSADIIRSFGLRYRAVDEDQSELDKAGRAETAAFDICEKDATRPGSPYQSICSRRSAEHFRDPSQAYRNILLSLALGTQCSFIRVSLVFTVFRQQDDAFVGI